MVDLTKIIDAEHQKNAAQADAQTHMPDAATPTPVAPLGAAPAAAASILTQVAAAATDHAQTVAAQTVQTAATIAKEVAQDTVASVQDMVSHAGDITKDVHSVADAQELLKNATEQLAKAAMRETIEKIEGVIGIDIDQDGKTGEAKA